LIYFISGNQILQNIQGKFSHKAPVYDFLKYNCFQEKTNCTIDLLTFSEIIIPTAPLML